jgi:hypothetical protein
MLGQDVVEDLALPKQVPVDQLSLVLGIRGVYGPFVRPSLGLLFGGRGCRVRWRQRVRGVLKGVREELTAISLPQDDLVVVFLTANQGTYLRKA